MGKRCVFLLYNLLSPDSASPIRQELAVSTDYILEMAYSPKEVVEKIRSGKVDCVIFNIGNCDVKTLKGLEKLKAESETTVAMVVCEKAHKEVYRALKKMKGIVILEA